MALIRVCDICDKRLYDNERFYTLIYSKDLGDDTTKERIYENEASEMEICKKCFGTISEQIKNKRDAEKKEAVDDN